MKYNLLLTIFASIFLVYSCKDDDQTEPEMQDFLCCGDNPFESSNVDNLDQSLGEIIPIEIFTPNEDGLNDHFEIENLEFYPNNTVTIYDLDNNIVFQKENYNDVDETMQGIPFSQNAFVGVNEINNSLLESGSYKYEIIIENENTFLKRGFVCFLRLEDSTNGMDFNDCLNGIFDPVL